jgi:tetratricopeptide (TPR) repeat protein
MSVMKRSRWFLGWLVVGVLSLGTAHAQTAAPLKPEDSAEARAARAHYDQAEAFYLAKNYEAARIEFEAAYRLYPAPDLLFNLAKTAEKQGRPKEAIEYLEQYKRAKQDAAASEASAEVDRELARLRGQTDQASVPRPVPAPTPQPGPAHSAEQSRRPPNLAIGLLAGGGAVLLTGIGCGAAALALGLDVRDRPAQPLEQLQPDLERGRALDGATIGLSVVGGVALGTGAALWIVDAIKRRRSLPPSVSALHSGFVR